HLPSPAAHCFGAVFLPAGALPAGLLPVNQDHAALATPPAVPLRLRAQLPAPLPAAALPPAAVPGPAFAPRAPPVLLPSGPAPASCIPADARGTTLLSPPRLLSLPPLTCQGNLLRAC